MLDIYEMMQKPMILGDCIANHELFVADMQHEFVVMGNAERLANIIVQRIDR